MCMSKQTLLNCFPFVWILTVGLCYFILIAFTLYFLPLLHITCWHQLQMEMMFQQFGNYRILINKIFPMELVFLEKSFFCLSLFHPGGETNLTRCSVHIGSRWEQKPVAYPHSSSPPPQNKPLTSGVRAAQMGLFWYISQIEITSRLHKFVLGEDGHAFLHSNEGLHQSALPQCPPKLHFFIHD